MRISVFCAGVSDTAAPVCELVVDAPACELGVVVVLWAEGLAAGAAFSSAVDFAAGAALSLALDFGFRGTLHDYILGIMALTAEGYFCLLAHRLYSTTLATLEARAEKDALIGELS